MSDARYEVTFLLDLTADRIDGLKAVLAAVGDAAVVVGGDSLWNCNVHTDDIGRAIEVALDVGGRPHHIRVTDLTEAAGADYARRLATRRGPVGERHGAFAAEAGGSVGLRTPTVTAVVAVGAGDGLSALFASLGVRQVVTGGLTMTPSTAELLAAVEMADADEVVILPNEPDVVSVAEQIDALTTKTVRVVPTRSMPEALAALVVYDPEGNVDANTRAMVTAVGHVRTGEVTRAVRAASIDGVDVREGEWLGSADGKVVACAPRLRDTALAVAASLVDGHTEIFTVLAGEGATSEATNALVDWMTGEYPGVEVEWHDGGQPRYPYLFGVE